MSRTLTLGDVKHSTSPSLSTSRVEDESRSHASLQALTFGDITQVAGMSTSVAGLAEGDAPIRKGRADPGVAS